MIFIFLTILFSSLIFVAFKLFPRFKIDNFQALTINYLAASTIGIIILGSEFNYEMIITKSWLPFSLLIGFVFIFTFILFALSSQKAGVAITAVFSKMSVIIPVIAGIFLYSEKLNALIVLGIISTFSAFILIFYKRGKNKIQISIIVLPIIIFFANGLIDTLLKYIEHYHIAGDYTLFLTMIFITALIIGSIISIYRYFKTKQAFTIQSIIGGTILGLFNYSTTYFMLLAMNLFESNVLFPLQNVGIVMLSALLGIFFFREKLSLTNWIGIFLSILAILLIALA
ncbi:MAG: DMT family transporter [Bacteroidetes bacterium]|nr:DMT family transporter [Bacteroidota bacterium]